MAEMTHVPGIRRGKIVLYALSTCIWCKKTRALLEEIGVEYDYVYVDLLDTRGKEEAKKEIQKWNPSCSFPTIVINDNKCIIGFKENAIRKELE